MHLKDFIGNSYLKWQSNKIFIKAQTGLGKSTFIIQVLLELYKNTGQKLLIICNRRLLRKQYWYELIQKYEKYAELKKVVEVVTYQEISQAIMNGANVDLLFRDFSGICLDECHYFVADADFNSFGTYATLQAIIRAGLYHLMIFMSATPDDVFPWIKKIIRAWSAKISYEEKLRIEENCLQFIDYDIPEKGYTYVNCAVVDDKQTLVDYFAKSPEKGIIFWDDKKGAEEIAKLLVERGGIEKKEIAMLNAENLENTENSNVVKTLAMANKLAVKILLTTSVLDNGISIHDDDVCNIAIITDSKTSFFQMLGRVRITGERKLNLIFLKRKVSYFAKRENVLKSMLDVAENLNENSIYYNRYSILESLRSDDEMAKVYRRVLVFMPDELDVLNKNSTYINYGDVRVCVNQFAIEKLGDNFMMVSRFHKMAMNSELDPIFCQMEWLHKGKEELEVIESNYSSEQKEELREKLQQIKDYSQKQLSDLKEELAKTYRTTALSKYGVRNRAFDRATLEQVLEDNRLQLDVKTVDGRNSYSVSSRV